MTNYELLKSINRCKTCDIRTLLSRWTFISNEELEAVDLKQTKNLIASSLTTICRDKDGFESSVPEFDLICTQTYSHKKSWSVFHMNMKKEKSNDTILSNPRKFKLKLRRQVAVYFEEGTNVAVNIYKGAVWTRLYVAAPVGRDRGKVYRPNNAVYMVYFPNTEYVIISHYKASIESNLHQTLQNTFGVSKVTKTLLTGRHIDSLIQLALNKNTQGSFKQYTQDEFQRAPYSKTKPRKRKRPEDDFERNTNISCENDAKKRKRSQLLEDEFGPNEQPTLEKIEYKVNLGFRGATHATGMANRSELFKCKVKFEGSSVLEGLRCLGEMGIARMPLPTHLGKVHTMAKNHFTIQEHKSRTGTGR